MLMIAALAALGALADDQVNIQWKYDAKWGSFWTPADWSDGRNWDGGVAPEAEPTWYRGSDEGATYEVETWGGGRETLSGAALRSWRVEFRSPRTFRLVFYRKI